MTRTRSPAATERTRSSRSSARFLPALLEYRVVRTTDDLLADHEAPTYVDDPEVRATFWPPLDELVDAAR